MREITEENEPNEKQEKFCREYLIDFNGKQAAIRAGYSPDSAEVQASRLLTYAKVNARLKQLKLEQNARLELSADTVVQKLLLIVNADLGQAYDDEGNLLPIHLMPDDVRLALSAYDMNLTKEGMSQKIKLTDKLKALELLGRHLKMFTDKVEHSGKLTLAELVINSLKEESSGKENV